MTVFSITLYTQDKKISECHLNSSNGWTQHYLEEVSLLDRVLHVGKGIAVEEKKKEYNSCVTRVDEHW